jgi:bifunctional non-homologous end joining protein LigD
VFVQLRPAGFRAAVAAPPSDPSAGRHVCENRHSRLTSPPGSSALQIERPLLSQPEFRALLGARLTNSLAGSALATVVADQRNDVVTDMSRRLRKGKILIDWSQNTPHKTTVSVYSLRATPTPSVSTPISWEEVDRCWRKKNAKVLSFSPKDVLRRVSTKGDLFAPVLKLKQKLPRLS